MSKPKPVQSRKRSTRIAKRKQKNDQRKSRFWIFGRGSRMDITIQICGLLVILLGVTTAIVAVSPLRDKFSVTLWLGFGTGVLALLGICLYVQNRHWDGDVSQANANAAPFAIAIGTGLGTDQRAVNKAATWYSWYQSPLGDTLSPVHRMMVIRITNRQAVRSQIETYRVEAKTADGRWVRLTWMDGQRGGVYWIFGDARNATHIDIVKLDSVLSNQVLMPNETVEGWAFFEIPENIPLRQPLRVYVKDFGGAEITQEVARPIEFAQGAGLGQLGTRDLSNAVLRYYSEVPR